MMKRFLQQKNTRMYHVWLRSFIVCLCLALAGVSAWGQEYGNFEVTGENVTYENGILTISSSGVTVKNKTPETATSDRIVIEGGSVDSPIEVTLAGVNISSSLNSAIAVSGYASLILQGDENKLESTSSDGVISIAKESNLLIKEGALSFITGSISAIKGGYNKSSLSIKNASISIIGKNNQNCRGIETSDNITIVNSTIKIESKQIDQHPTEGLHSDNILLKNSMLLMQSSAKSSSAPSRSLTSINVGNELTVDNSVILTVGSISFRYSTKRAECEKTWSGIVFEKYIYGGDIKCIGTVYGNPTLKSSFKLVDIDGFNTTNKMAFFVPEGTSVEIKDNSKITTNGAKILLGEGVEPTGYIKPSSFNTFYQIKFEKPSDWPFDKEPESVIEEYKTNDKNPSKVLKIKSNDEQLVFAKPSESLYLYIKDNSNNYELISFNAKYGETTIPSKAGESPYFVPSFNMPEHSVKITDIVVEKESIGLYLDYFTWIKATFYNEKGEQIEKAPINSKVYAVIEVADEYKGVSAMNPTGSGVFDDQGIAMPTVYLETIKGHDVFLEAGSELARYRKKVAHETINCLATRYVYEFIMPKTVPANKQAVGLHCSASRFDLKYFNVGVTSTDAGIITVKEKDGTEFTTELKDVAFKTTIQVNVKPSEGADYIENSLKYRKITTGEEVAIENQGGEFTFEMPASDVEVFATFKKYHKIVVSENVNNGKLELKGTFVRDNNTVAYENDKITIIPDPMDGYRLKAGTLQYSCNNGTFQEIELVNGEYSFSMPAGDVNIIAEFEPIPQIYTVTLRSNSDIMGKVSGGGSYEDGTEVSILATPTDVTKYEFVNWTDEKGSVISTNAEYKFKVTQNVVYIANFIEKEDPTDPEEPIDPPVDPINYYNIYNETTYDFIDVSFSRNVVREGGSVNVYLGIPEGLDPAAVTLMFKRGMYNNWETLDEGVQPGEYPINNIWSDIYVKAVVDESYIDPNPDENHIYIDLSETNDSIWLYTERKLVEEGKTAVIQAEVAKSCQNKEIRYMYKRTVLGEWKEMPKDYSINQYVVRDITTDIYVKAYFVFDKQDPTTAKNPHHVYADITATCEGLYLDATRHKVADEGDTKVFLYVKKGFETKDARYLFKRGLKGEWEDLVPGIEQNTFQVTDIEGDIYLKGIDAVYTGTEDIDGMVRVYTKDGSLFVYTTQPEEISVVSMTGVTVKRTQQTGLQSYPLNQGIYVVRVGEQVFKVRVK